MATKAINVQVGSEVLLVDYELLDKQITAVYNCVAMYEVSDSDKDLLEGVAELLTRIQECAE